MRWQDVLVSLGATISAIALIPSVRGANKPALSSSLMIGTILVINGICFATLSLWLTAVLQIVLAILWFILGWQVWMRPRRLVETSVGLADAPNITN